jgi:RNA binding exosome subunit
VSSKLPIAYIDIRVLANATEDPEKVLTAVRNILPEELRERVIFQKTALTGHHGNPIILFRTKLTDKQALLSVLEKIGAGLTPLDKDTLDRNLKLHLEKRNLYIRFYKQSAYNSKFRISHNDPIHFKIHFKNKIFSEIIEICRNAGVLP